MGPLPHSSGTTAVLTINGLGRAGAPTQSIGLRLSPRRLRRVESIYLVCITITNYSCRSGNMLAWDNTAWRGLTRTDALADGPTKGFAVSGAPPPGPGTPCKRACFLRTNLNHRSVPILSTECDLDQYQIAPETDWCIEWVKCTARSRRRYALGIDVSRCMPERCPFPLPVRPKKRKRKGILHSAAVHSVRLQLLHLSGPTIHPGSMPYGR